MTNVPEREPPPDRIQPTMLRPPRPKPTWHVWVGLLLALPALVMLLLSYVLPVAWTVRSSFRRFSGVRLGEGESTGAGNYERAFDRGLAGDFGFALSLAVVPLLVLLLVAPALAYAAHRAGREARWATRVALALPLAAYAPAAVAAAGLDGSGGVDDPGGIVRTVSGLGMLGLVTALGVTLYLAALRRRDPERRPWPALAVCAALAAAGALAVALQAFTAPFVAGLSGDATSTPAGLMFDFGFRLFDFGAAASVATLLLLVLALLGIAATLLIIRSGLRLEFDDAHRTADDPQPRRVPLRVGLGVGVLVVLIVWVDALWPWLRDITQESPGAPAGVYGNTWLPPLVSAIVGVTVAALAAFGISGLRPLGRHSEWLLVPFGVFLFVGMGPLALRAYAAGQTATRLDSFLGLVPPTRLVIPALFVLALLFRGQALRREALHQEGRRMPWSRVVLPALPMLGLAYLVTWLVHAQSVLWQLMTAAGKYVTGPVVFVGSLVEAAPGARPYGLVLPVALLVVLALVAIAAQVLYLDRIGLRIGPPERDHPPRT